MVNIKETTTKLIQNLSKRFPSIDIQEKINKKKWNYLIHDVKTSEKQIQKSFLISNIPPEGILINKPGIYSFENNINWYPSDSITCILIQSDNVILDFNNFSLNCINPLNLQTEGICISNSKNNIIKNGDISLMGLRGIRIENCTNILIKNIIIDGLTVVDISSFIVPSGIFSYQNLNIKISDCTIKNIKVKTDSMAGIQFTETINSFIENCLLENFINLDGACTGIGHLLCEGSIIKNCITNNFQSFFNGNIKTQGHTCIGYIPVFSINLEFENCSASNIFGCCDDAHGFSLFLCFGNLNVKNCSVENVQDGVGTEIGAKATGIEIYATDVCVSNCKVNNIIAINPQDKQATGFSCALETNVKIIDCKASNVLVIDEFGNKNSSLGYGTGFGWAPDPRPEFAIPATNVLYENCEANFCDVGFDTWYHINSTWKNIYSNNCGIALFNWNDSQRTLSCSPCSECNPPITVTLTNVALGNKFENVHVKY